jgi:hypothetical protein
MAGLGAIALPQGPLRWLTALDPGGPNVGLDVAAQLWGIHLGLGSGVRGSVLRLGLRWGRPHPMLGVRAALPLPQGGRPPALVLWAGSARGQGGLRAQVRLWRPPHGPVAVAPALGIRGTLLAVKRAQVWGQGALSLAMPEGCWRGQARLGLRLGRAVVRLQGGASWGGADPRRHPSARWRAMGAIEGFYAL